MNDILVAKGSFEVRVYGKTRLETESPNFALIHRQTLQQLGQPAELIYIAPNGKTYAEAGIPLYAMNA